MYCIGHRGNSIRLPENTLCALESAYEKSNGFETDLRLTQDNQVILMHDSTLDRTTDGTGVVSKRRYSNYIKDLYTKSNQGIPMLSKLLDRLVNIKRKDKLVIFDIKEDNPIEILRYISAMFSLNKYQGLTSTVNFILGIWSIEFLEYICKDLILSRFKVCFIMDVDQGTPLEEIKKKIIDIHERYPCIEWVSLNHQVVSQELVDFVHQQGVKVCVYTVNKKDQIHSIVKLKIDLLLTDDPVLGYSIVHHHNTHGS